MPVGKLNPNAPAWAPIETQLAGLKVGKKQAAGGSSSGRAGGGSRPSAAAGAAAAAAAGPSNGGEHDHDELQFEDVFHGGREDESESSTPRSGVSPLHCCMLALAEARRGGQARQVATLYKRQQCS